MAKGILWTRDELILTMDLYFKVNLSRVSGASPEIQELSEVLKRLPVHPVSVRGEKFRNPHGVYMKLCNLMRLDPNYEGKGLGRGGKLEEIIWAEYYHERSLLEETAASIRKRSGEISPPMDREEAEIQSQEEFAEGRILTLTHQKRERNPTAVRKKKQRVRELTGRLICEVCDFDFEEFYGPSGKGFAECHHRVPLSELSECVKTRLSDLAIVCANCHRILHRIRPWITVEELRRSIRG